MITCNRSQHPQNYSAGNSIFFQIFLNSIALLFSSILYLHYIQIALNFLLVQTSHFILTVSPQLCWVKYVYWVALHNKFNYYYFVAITRITRDKTQMSKSHLPKPIFKNANSNPKTLTPSHWRFDWTPQRWLSRFCFAPFCPCPWY